jgi:hypothetical protein
MNWPDEVKEQLGGREPKIGDWFTVCLGLGVLQVKTQDELDRLYEEVERYMDEGIIFDGFFESREQALSARKEQGLNAKSTTRKGPPAVSLDEWLKAEGRDIQTWDNYAMLHKAHWFYARLKDQGAVVSVGAGPSPKAALEDVWENLPSSRR